MDDAKPTNAAELEQFLGLVRKETNGADESLLITQLLELAASSKAAIKRWKLVSPFVEALLRVGEMHPATENGAVALGRAIEIAKDDESVVERAFTIATDPLRFTKGSELGHFRRMVEHLPRSASTAKHFARFYEGIEDMAKHELLWNADQLRAAGAIAWYGDALRKSRQEIATPPPAARAELRLLIGIKQHARMTEPISGVDNMTIVAFLSKFTKAERDAAK